MNIVLYLNERDYSIMYIHALSYRLTYPRLRYFNPNPYGNFFGLNYVRKLVISIASQWLWNRDALAILSNKYRVNEVGTRSKICQGGKGYPGHNL